MKKYNMIISSLLVFLAVLIFYGTKDFTPYISKVPGAGAWPRMLALTLVFLSAALVVETFVSNNDADDTEPINFKGPEMKCVYIMLGIFFGYAIVLYVGGFVVASLLFIPSVMYLLGEVNVKKMALTSIVVTSVVYFFFAVLLKITLPQPFFM